ncbi:hypothetical protein Q3G72_033505 [Acer saccharum]|nr:hypothetical protein Q3G72_033505 [Acer saccharum]
MDVHMEGQYPTTAAFQAAELTQKCLDLNPQNRPSMKEVVEVFKMERCGNNTSSTAAHQLSASLSSLRKKICRLLEEESVVNQYGVKSIFCRELENFDKIANADKVSNVEKINMIMPDVEKFCKDRLDELDGFKSCNEIQTSSSPAKARKIDNGVITLGELSIMNLVDIQKHV